MKRLTAISAAVLAAVVLLGPAYQAASPPGFVNYQGVLRDAADKPLDGDYDMVFRFITAATGGSEILIDRHTAGDSAPVTVSGGLFSVRLGAGAIQDGDGFGSYTSLAQVFRDYPEVWLRVEVGGEVLDPRVRVVSAAYALNADHLDGMTSTEFVNTSAASQTKAGRFSIVASTPGLFGLQVYSMEGAYFEDSDQSGVAYAANGNWGVGGYGNVGGGHFEDSNSSGYANVGYGDYGIQAYGNIAGGTFENPVGGSSAHVGRENYGIRAYGNIAGGTFDDLNGSGYAYVGYGDHGIEASGNLSGGRFLDSDGSGYANVGTGDYGIYAEGDLAGGEFREGNTPAYAYIAGDYYGVNAYGSSGGLSNLGAGLRAADLDTGNYAKLAWVTFSTAGNGEKNFVQNHPYDPDRVIAYASLEGDEVGTYTRGTARLSDGEATVPLGETFKWVTNPDIGLTAHLTPRGEPVVLSVASISTEELVVLGPEGSDAVFDYVVYGLRIGFEETPRVREKTVESFIPSMKSHQELYEQHPELQRFNSLERFKAMAASVDGRDAVDLSRAASLKAEIQEYDPAVHGPVDQLLGLEPLRRDPGNGEGSPDETTPAPDGSTLDTPAPATSPIVGATDRQAPPERLLADELRGDRIPVSEHAEAGQVLALDPEHPGKARAANSMADPGVIGVAVGMVDDTFEARVAATGFVECNVDAGYGAIKAGDLLTTSPMAGHAMRALDVTPGTILGKALEPLEVGTGTIKILVMPR